MTHIIYYILAICLGVFSTHIGQPIKTHANNSLTKIAESISIDETERKWKALDSINLDKLLKLDVELEEIFIKKDH